MTRLAIRTALHRRGRLLLTVLSIVLGVGFMTSTLALGDSIREGTDDTFAPVGATSDLLVRAEASFGESDGPDRREPMPASTLDAVGSVGGVDRAVGAVSGDGLVGSPDGSAWSTGAIVYSADGIGTVSPFRLTSGRAPDGRSEVALDAGTARAEGVEVGDEVAVQASGSTTATVVGLAALGDTEEIPGTAVVLPDLTTAQHLLGRADRLDEILVTVAPGSDVDDVARRIADVVPGSEVVTSQEVADERAADSQGAAGMLTTLLNGFALISLFVGGFVILNTFTVIVAQRTRETGLLRALGASTRQVTSGVLLEALVVGAVASVLGVVAGVGMTVALRWAADALDAGLADGGLVLTPRTLVLPVAIGVALTLVASYVPARRAGRLTPMAALRDVDRRVVVGRLRILAGIVLGVVSPLVGIVGVPLAMVAAALLAPALVPLTARVAGPVLRRVGGVPGRLGAQNAVRNPIRTGATASALTIGLSLVVGMTIVADSTLSSFTTALERSVRSDLIVNSPDADGISPGLADELAGLDEVGAVARMRYGQFELLDAVHPDESGPQELLAVDPATYGDAFDLGVVEGRIPDLADGGVIALDEVADREGWRVGDTVRMRFAGAGVQELRIDGIYTDPTLEDQGFVVSITDYERWFSEQLDARVFVSAAPGVTVDAAQGAVERVARRFPGVEVNTAESFIAETTSMIDMVLAAVNVLLGLAVVIAVLGIVNTLALSMHERTRELGLVRAVGMSRRQVRAMVRWESVVMSLLGSALALVVGLVVGRAVLAQVASRFGDQMTFPPVRLAVLVALGAAVGLAAAVLPARQAARTEILDAMRLA